MGPGHKPSGWLSRRRAKHEAQQRAHSSGQKALQAVVTPAVKGDGSALAAIPDAVEEARRIWPDDKSLNEAVLDALCVAARKVIRDKVLTPDEHQNIDAVGRAMGIEKRVTGGSEDPSPFDVIRVLEFPLFEDLMVARMNGGWLPDPQSARSVLLRSGECAYGTWSAELMTEEVIKEHRGSTAGVTVPLPFGVRVGGSDYRGRTVTIGTRSVAEDHGDLIITSERTMFTGNKKTLEIGHEKLVHAELYKDGLRLGASSRQANILLRLANNRQTSPMLALTLLRSVVAKHRGRQ
jgi:hypothetical protein